MKVLVTGSSGFIGTNLMQRLGAAARPFDLTQDQDVSSETDIAAAMAGIDAVVHLAAFSGVAPSLADPAATLENAFGTLLLLEACRRTGASFVLASTAGALSGLPRSPYAASKLAAEAYCHAYTASFGVRTAIVRLANVYGPHSRHKATAIPSFCKALLAHEPLAVYGSGNQERDFIYVDDVCDGIGRILDTGATGRFVLASGRTSTINLVIKLLGVVSQREVEVVYKEARAGEVTAVDPPKASELRFEAKTDLATGLKQTWDWFQATR